MKRLNRLTYCFSKSLRHLEAAFVMWAAYYNFCWQTRMPGKKGKLRPSAAMMAGLTNHVWSFDEFVQHGAEQWVRQSKESVAARLRCWCLVAFCFYTR
jgi:hypothetical protein